MSRSPVLRPGVVRVHPGPVVSSVLENRSVVLTCLPGCVDARDVKWPRRSNNRCNGVDGD